METECTYDYLFVYDGDSYQNPLLASLSGNTLPQPIEAKSGKVTASLSMEGGTRHVLRCQISTSDCWAFGWGNLIPALNGWIY
jgi:hypothetical protein